LTVFGARHEAAAVEVKDSRARVEADARALDRLELRRRKPREPAEQQRTIALPETRAFVPHRDFHSAFRSGRVEPDEPALLPVFGRVAEQIQQDDLYQLRIAGAGEGPAGRLAPEAQAGRPDVRLHGLDGRIEDVPDQLDAGPKVRLQGALFHPGQLQIVPDQIQEPVALPLDAVNDVPLFLGERPRQPGSQGVPVQDHGGERPPEFVADEAQHFRVGLVGRGELFEAPGLFHGLAQAFGQGEVQRHLAVVVGRRLERTPEKDADDPAVHGERTGEAGADAFLNQEPGRNTLRVLDKIGGQIRDNARAAFLDHPLQRTSFEGFRIPRLQSHRLVGGARPLGDQSFPAFVQEGDAQAVARREGPGGVEQKRQGGVQRRLAGDLAVDQIEDAALFGGEGGRRGAARIAERLEAFGHGAKGTDGESEYRKGIQKTGQNPRVCRAPVKQGNGLGSCRAGACATPVTGAPQAAALQRQTVPLPSLLLFEPRAQVYSSRFNGFFP